jgi:hypothetical protein
LKQPEPEETDEQTIATRVTDRLFREHIAEATKAASLLDNMHRRWLDTIEPDDATLLQRLHEIRRARGKLTSVMATLSDTLAVRQGASWLQQRRAFGIPLPLGQWDLSDPNPEPPELPGM